MAPLRVKPDSLGPVLDRPLLSLQPSSAKPGDPVVVTVRGAAGLPTGTLGGRPLRFFAWREGHLALTSLPVELPPGTQVVDVMAPGKGLPVALSGALEVLAPGYRERELRVASKYVSPPKAVKARMEADRKAFAAAFAQPFREPLFGQNFAWPRQDVVTAPFGDRRSFNGKLQSQHFGVDLDGDPGAPVVAANDGTVVMARDNYASGNTVLVHHGAGLFTAYFHLSRIDVKDGAQVKQGDGLGLVGSTGRVTGPHLHWGVKADDRWVDGQTLLKLDFFGAQETPGVAVSSPELANP
ncbi:M23 family metallopeptidase [Corallococcus praedator]|uniref:M23 family metallopeptidase n=2 Tax=Myxococcaceae TaxID=31 RepID=A0ABX9QNY6_9BACT|nr:MULTISPECIES: M23 family metallopeptidase [Corallococcus]RKH19529.1 M23 family metallopeptidase [Corallococcus sp. CA047B]RKH33846.1 M23 family metallopeptidase [Corallococcus sp. CA031C]RKI15124.1 M23 family metallopeptidase [Corallococcus praedator]